jgi:hypothetical protein
MILMFVNLGTGVISASGGAGACVPHCANCDSYRRCLSCNAGYTWDHYICVGASITAEVSFMSYHES